MSRRSVSLGNPAPTEFAPSKPVTNITLPDSLGDISSGISWDIPHLGEIDMSAASLPAEQVPRTSELSPSLPSVSEGADQAEVKRDEKPLSDAIDIILARSRVYAPSRRNEPEPWWTTRSEESISAAERARSKLQDHQPPAGMELYLVYPVDSCNAQQTRSIDKHLQDSVEAYAMQRSNLFEGGLVLARLPHPVLKVEHQPSTKPRTPRPAGEPDFTPPRENKQIMYRKPPADRKLYHIEPRDRRDEQALRPLVDQLEAMAGSEGNLYTATTDGGIWFWHAFLTESEAEQMKAMQEVERVELKRPTDENGHEYDPTD
ncbi:hypothetical protein PG993_003649 [Apiospora rasikravindrae]|uniref:Uncharacterized protein n=1 Tax=Apiospora rasikravindrae TaxID=990691 RepID=A0ABR1U2W5_9PEZI